MKMQLECTNVFVQLGGKPVIRHINLHVDTDENLAISGESGSGKSSLAKAISQKIFFRGEISFLSEEGRKISPHIILIEQQHAFKNNSNVSNFYYQQRFNSCDAEDTRTVVDELSNALPEDVDSWIDRLGLTNILHKPIIQLSNGENKRLQLVKAIIQKPDLIILDTPFTGLDASGRETLVQILTELTKTEIKIILIAQLEDIPDCMDKIIVLKDGIIESNQCNQKQETKSIDAGFTQDKISTQNLDLLKNIYAEKTPAFTEAIRMEEVTISYSGRNILTDVNWRVSKGERWLVTGANGSGKSTLLSLINADNPQAYANKIWLFERKRGSGESIWEIKKNIGYVSPELHLYFDKGISVFDAVASGLFDTIGLFRKPTNNQIEKINTWLKVIGVEDLGTRMMHQLSLGQQRLVMLARALVKAPPLLILDEPCQGLDAKQTNGFKSLIEAICQVSDTTLIYVSHYTNDIPKSIQKKLSLIEGYALQDIS
jgi:molybdate transport system ATP-binding protein